MSVTHLVLLFLILMLVFGPQKLEGIGTSLGRAVRGFKKGLEEGGLAEEKKDAPATPPSGTPTV